MLYGKEGMSERSELKLPGGKKGALIKAKDAPQDWLAHDQQVRDFLLKLVGGKTFEDIIAIQTERKQTAERFAKEVAAGKYESREKAQQAYAKAIGKAK
jgi:hypothetical protein